MQRGFRRVAIVLAFGSLAGCATVSSEAPVDRAPAAKQEGQGQPAPPGGSVYHTTPPTGEEGVSVVPYGGNRLGDNPYTSEEYFY